MPNRSYFEDYQLPESDNDRLAARASRTQTQIREYLITEQLETQYAYLYNRFFETRETWTWKEFLSYLQDILQKLKNAPDLTVFSLTEGEGS